MTPYDEVLDFWFVETGPKSWWTADPAFDERIRGRFAALHARAARGELYAWRADAAGPARGDHRPRPVLAEPVPRIGARPSPRTSRRWCSRRKRLRPGRTVELEPVQRAFLLLPYMHSESREIHVVAERLYPRVRARRKPRLRAAAQGDRGPLRPLSAPQRGARAHLDARGNRVPQAAGIVVLKPRAAYCLR